MAPSDAFSTVANAFSVVGLADVVFKYGREVVETLVKIHNAPKQIEVLIREIKYVEDHVARVRIFISDLAQSALAKTNQDVILVIEALLFRCQQEFIVIHKSAHDATIASANGWLTRFSKKAKWVWEEQDIALSCRRLGKMRTELDSALALAGRRTDIEVYEEITKARADITQMSAKSSKELDDLGTTIEHEAEAVAQKIHALPRDTVVSLDGIRSVALDTQRVACSSAAGIEKKVEAAIKKSTKQNLALRNQYDAGNGALRRDLKAVSKEYTSSTKKMARKQNAATAKILAKLGEVHSDVATLSLTRSSRECFTFEGTNLESATLPLMLLHSELVNALPILKSEGKVQVSQSEASWVEHQFETVLAASHEASA
ncbi:hypothetical protein B0J12DRAFT_405150 [Macrophomina phaseolina]|uniref:Fungal N-terminal domain-containing protein n=1 Tax=Macrophomina phaseolina TaxID=35725 RepID=A0ABQ8GIQ9_9PEZI|nr:hypothetical protein B0J12DRAFT_405150 [Macrophomina phaseolina]